MQLYIYLFSAAYLLEFDLFQVLYLVVCLILDLIGIGSSLYLSLCVLVWHWVDVL